MKKFIIVILLFFLIFFIFIIQQNQLFSTFFDEEKVLAYPSGWHRGLPACPCTYTEATELKETVNPKGKWLICGEANSTYHYGATYEIRWTPFQRGHPGQQCTYDTNGNLITAGIAAGSPDKVSPCACSFGISSIMNISSLLKHKKEDVDTWKKISCIEYLENWPINNMNSCDENQITNILHMKRLIGNMTCEQVTELFKIVDQDSTQIILKKYFYNELNDTPKNLQELIISLQKKLNCQNKYNNTCKTINQAVSNLNDN